MTTDFTQSSNPSPTMELLLRALQHEWPPTTVADMTALSPVAWVALVTEAQRQRVAALLAWHLRQQELIDQVPTQVHTQLVQAHQEIAVRNLVLYHHLGQLIRALEAQAIPTILLKGAYLAATVYEDMALRHMVDADLLVPESALDTAIEIVIALGYQPLTPLMPVHLYRTHAHHLPRFFKEGSLSVEIHWTITRPNQVYTIPMTDLWARAQPATVAGIEVSTLAPEDLLLHVCLHATYQHLLEQGVRFLCDIDAICRHFGSPSNGRPTLDWEKVVARAQAWNWARGVYLALHLAHDLLATPIPEHVLTKLQANMDTTQLPIELKSALASSHSVQARTYSRFFAKMWHEQGVRNKVRIVWQRLFLPRDQLATKHGIATTSPRLLWYYGVRVTDLLRRYGGTVLLSRQQRSVTNAGLQQKIQLTTWLES
ncbi:MAG: nucleotidyltransferase family protein [Caldilineaceae bacterium]|nr:nucleotidyltransferase family protein [Caldilineaceae bacterium]